MFDSTCRFIAANFAMDMATWLLGKPINLTELKGLIQRILREDIVKESVIYQEITASAREKGFSEGIEPG